MIPLWKSLNELRCPRGRLGTLQAPPSPAFHGKNRDKPSWKHHDGELKKEKLQVNDICHGQAKLIF